MGEAHILWRSLGVDHLLSSLFFLLPVGLLPKGMQWTSFCALMVASLAGHLPACIEICGTKAYCVQSPLDDELRFLSLMQRDGRCEIKVSAE